MKMMMSKKKSDKGIKESMTAVGSGESLTEIGKLNEIIKFAEESLRNHRLIIKKKRNLEFRTKNSVDVTSREIAELNIDGYTNRSDIKEINAKRSGNEAVLFIRRTIVKTD
jgi:hypothetical protein